MNDKGLRFNEGKTRHDLVPQFAQQQYALVLTKGSQKYAERNWELGMRWSKVTASLKRHLEAFELGEDYDKESGLLHTAHIMCNAAFLTEYYRIYPQGDDRPHLYLKKAKIGLDIDEVICDWINHWCKRDGIKVIPENWSFDFNINEKFEKLKDDKDFWLSIPPKIKPSEIPFEPHCYITSRSVPVEWTKEWLAKNGFPQTMVYSIPFGASKEVAKESGIDIFVDDKFDNFVELNNAGICTFLMDTPQNQRYKVGYKRIKSLNELMFL